MAKTSNCLVGKYSRIRRELSLAIEHAEVVCNITHHHDSDSDGDMPELIDADSNSDDKEGDDNVLYIRPIQQRKCISKS